MITGIAIARRADCATTRRICLLEPGICVRCVCFGSTLPHQWGGRTPPRTRVTKNVKSVPEEVALGTALPLGEAGRTRPKKDQVSCIIAAAT